MKKKLTVLVLLGLLLSSGSLFAANVNFGKYPANFKGGNVLAGVGVEYGWGLGVGGVFDYGLPIGGLPFSVGATVGLGLTPQIGFGGALFRFGYHPDINLVPNLNFYAIASIGYYGMFIGGPSLGVRYFVNKSMAIFLEGGFPYYGLLGLTFKL